MDSIFDQTKPSNQRLSLYKRKDVYSLQLRKAQRSDTGDFYVTVEPNYAVSKVDFEKEDQRLVDKYVYLKTLIRVEVY